ncbi:MAG TPA: SRPBCC family protein [Polyangiales bacterium]|nr:SRPBCC family protein [Polyangiales bacterium]
MDLTRRTAAAILLTSGALVAWRAPLGAQPVHVSQGSAPETSVAGVLIGAPPHDVYARVTAYHHWAHVFSDVSSVEVRSGASRDAVVRFTSRALRHTVTVRFDNVVDREVRFTLIEGPPGAVASGRYRLEPKDAGRKTYVAATLRMDVGGVFGWLISADTLRQMREDKLRIDLADIARAFSRRDRT